MKKQKQVTKIKLADFLTKNSQRKLTPEEEEFELDEKVAAIDEKFDVLSKSIGRTLSEDEELEIMDILDELTPKDKNGKYLVELLPFEYAWQIYEARKDAQLDDFLGELEIEY